MHPYFQPILHVLGQHEELGVNAIAKELDAPVASVQVYLVKKQSYFVKNVDTKKWRLPTLETGEYPMEPGKTAEDITPGMQKILDDPVANITKLLDLIRQMHIAVELTQRRIVYLQNLAHKAVKII